MTKKDFILVADALVDAYIQARTPGEKRGVSMARARLARDLERAFPRFNPGRFEQYIDTRIKS